ncbi:MAG: MBL fold metallo-hydrolase [Desulfobacteraceae bacterium]|nr:MAG: MBL fold metallo-hydrolase [Desulfobacteraceae bacterium]
MDVTFWGVRGSIPTPGYDTARYGGNTLCIEIAPEGCGRTLVIDAGSGIRSLGNDLITRSGWTEGAARVDLFLSHTHLDHILGLPFFRPFYHPSTRAVIYGPVISAADSLEQVIGGQLSYRYFPVRQVELSAEIRYVDLTEGDIEVGDGIRVGATYLNHPLLCMGYRVEQGGKIVCTAFDTEPFHNIFTSDPTDPGYDEQMALEGERAAREAEERLTRFFSGADLLIYDGQFTAAEYRAGRAGWGHSAIEHAVAAAEKSGARRLALVHHDPMRSDEELDELARIHGGFRPGDGPEVIFAREGLRLTL